MHNLNHNSSYQNMMRRMLATNKLRQTKVENPSAFPDFLMSRYCGMNGNTPPKIIAPWQTMLMNSVRLGMVIPLKGSKRTAGIM